MEEKAQKTNISTIKESENAQGWLWLRTDHGMFKVDNVFRFQISKMTNDRHILNAFPDDPHQSSFIVLSGTEEECKSALSQIASAINKHREKNLKS